jgi:hypothetical protein
LSYKPSDLYLGVVDLFGILLPGALAALLFLDVGQRYIFNDELVPRLHGDFETIAAFVVGSYLLGLFADAIGSLGLDWLTDRTYRTRKLKAHAALMSQVAWLRKQELGRDTQLTSDFRWARASVYTRTLEGTRAIERLEASAKLFRSVTVVLVAATVKLALEGHPLAALVSLSLGALVLSRTAVQRWQRDKSTFEYYLISNPKTRKDQ